MSKLERGGKMYNGWKNYATWNIPLWVDNDYGLYKMRCWWLENIDHPVTAEDAKSFALGLFPNGTPDIVDNDWEGGRLCDVDWTEIAENWETDRQEL